MFGIGKASFNSPMTAVYLFLFILIINQFLIVHSFRLMSNDLDQVHTFELFFSILTIVIKKAKFPFYVS
jgi:hypothetical protein